MLFWVTMNRKVAAIIIALILVISISAAVAQETGYFFDFTNSNATINSAITNSSVIENVTITNGTLNLYIDADNISSVSINGINYTAQPPDNQTPPPTYTQIGAVTATIAYYGANIVPPGLTGFPSDPYHAWYEKNQTLPSYGYYTWRLTLQNINSMDSPNVPFDRILPSFVSKYPELLTRNETYPGTSNLTDVLTVRYDMTRFNANMANWCFVIFTRSELSPEQLNNLTVDLQTIVVPAIIEWYS
jgi:hypothetical protein